MEDREITILDEPASLASATFTEVPNGGKSGCEGTSIWQRVFPVDYLTAHDRIFSERK